MSLSVSRVDAVLDPFVSALYATPRIALLPLVMIWFRPMLRQGKVRLGNSCLDVGIARCDGERRAQMEDDTLHEEGSRSKSFRRLLSTQL